MADTILTIDRDELLTVIHKVVHRTMNIDFTWEWPCGVAFYGITKAWDVTGNEEYIEFLKNWVDEYMEIGLPKFTVNTVSMGHTLINLYQTRGEQKYLDLATAKAEYLQNTALRFGDRVLQHTVSAGNDFPGQAWADTLFMAAYFLLRLGRLLNNETYIEDALHQYLAHEELLQDVKTNLFYHGYDNSTKGHMSGVFWGRANAWAALTMAEAKNYINYLYPEFMAIDGTLRDHLAALVRLQSPNGLWHTVLDDANTYEEISASAGIAAALVLNRHPLHAKTVMAAYRGILDNIGEDGSVRNVSAGTAVMETVQNYNRVPRKRVQGWGQGLTLAFLSALVKYQQEAESKSK
ncbi:glycoside hydrolase family 88 protein [Marispirochaeta sp.]|uniref:glycoside hydrolase family 88 protein n=1 Tax=Marispirochaeta sp. TaxID=2038653 RepID=UPI0029C85D93|nr:glycoside hydrolase family 88 protein [Marispirochaeta sp.]